jgi:hypothetical protein
VKDPNFEAFCDRVEQEFFRLKARPGSLSPADFHRLRGWYESGWTLVAILDGVRAAFRAVASGRSAGVEEVNSLYYCEPFVEEAIRMRRGSPPRA